MKQIEALNSLINNSQKIVFFTGAGVSTPSGLSDFKSIYSKKFEGFSPIKIMTKGFYEKHPDIFLRFIKKYFTENAKPNICHYMIADIQNKWKQNSVVITQNIDGLHQKAGSRPVFEIHGSIQKWLCQDCKNKKFLSPNDILKLDNLKCQNNDCNGLMRPDIIFYDEDFNPLVLKMCQLQLEQADTLIVIGTSLKTLYAYNLVKNFNGKIVFINNEPLNEPLPKKVDLEIYDNVSNVFNQLKKEYENYYEIE